MLQMLSVSWGWELPPRMTMLRTMVVVRAGWRCRTGQVWVVVGFAEQPKDSEVNSGDGRKRSGSWRGGIGGALGDDEGDSSEKQGRSRGGEGVRRRQGQARGRMEKVRGQQRQ